MSNETDDVEQDAAFAQSDTIPERHRETMRDLARQWDVLGKHPGAMLLERLRELETFKAGVPGLAILDMRRMVERGSANDAVRAAVAAYDALEPKR